MEKIDEVMIAKGIIDRDYVKKSDLGLLYVAKKPVAVELHAQHKLKFIMSLTAIFFSIFSAFMALVGKYEALFSIIVITIIYTIVAAGDLRKMRYYETKYAIERGPMMVVPIDKKEESDKGDEDE